MLHDIFIYKTLETSQKPRQFALHIYIQKSGHFLVTQTFIESLKLEEGGKTFLNSQNTAHCVTFLYAKKMHSTLRFISKIYIFVLMPNYECLYDESDQIKNKSVLFIENWSYSYNILTIFDTCQIIRA